MLDESQIEITATPDALYQSNEQTISESLELDVLLIDTDFKNTRNKIEPRVVLSLADSIKENGLINPICVHKKDDGRFSLVAGFTRFEAIKTLKHQTVLARVYEGLTNAQLLEISLSENTVRQDLSIPQQLIAMKRVITELGHNDTATLASRLMWSKSHINSLLKIARSPDCVLTALESGDIELGHASYLVQLLDVGGGDIDQNITLIEKTVAKIKAEKWSIKALKQKVIAKHIPLNLAKFDTKQTCDGCEFNSSTYGSLFDFENEDALCTKPSCFQKHSLKLLDDVKSIAEERFGNVIMLSTVADTQVAPVSAEFLGETQLQTCNTCADNIAIINDAITASTFTQVKDGLCRNSKCYSKCTKAFTASQAKNPTSDQQTQPPTDKTDKTTSKPKNDTPFDLGQSTPKQKLLSQKDLSVAMLSRLNDEDVMQLLIGYALQSLTGKPHNIPDSIKANNLLVTGSKQESLKASYQLLTDYLSGSSKNDSIERNSPRAILLGLLANVSDKETLLKASWNAEHQLPIYTIKGIVAICEESGFAEHFGKSNFAKKASGSKPELLKAIKESAWSGWDDYYPQSHAQSVNFTTVTLPTSEE